VEYPLKSLGSYPSDRRSRFRALAIAVFAAASTDGAVQGPDEHRKHSFRRESPSLPARAARPTGSRLARSKTRHRPTCFTLSAPPPGRASSAAAAPGSCEELELARP
jgi:hypothetical protein